MKESHTLLLDHLLLASQWSLIVSKVVLLSLIMSSIKGWAKGYQEGETSSKEKKLVGWQQNNQWGWTLWKRKTNEQSTTTGPRQQVTLLDLTKILLKSTLEKENMLFMPNMFWRRHKVNVFLNFSSYILRTKSNRGSLNSGNLSSWRVQGTKKLQLSGIEKAETMVVNCKR